MGQQSKQQSPVVIVVLVLIILVAVFFLVKQIRKARPPVGPEAPITCEEMAPPTS